MSNRPRIKAHTLKSKPISNLGSSVRLSVGESACFVACRTRPDRTSSLLFSSVLTLFSTFFFGKSSTGLGRRDRENVCADSHECRWYSGGSSHRSVSSHHQELPQALQVHPLSRSLSFSFSRCVHLCECCTLLNQCREYLNGETSEFDVPLLVYRCTKRLD